MAKVKAFSQMSELVDFNNFRRFISSTLSDIIQKFNGTISFVENIRATGSGNKDNPSEPMVVFITDSEPTAIHHNLGFIPNGYIIVKNNTAANVYVPFNNPYEWTSDTIYLQATDPTTVSLYII